MAHIVGCVEAHELSTCKQGANQYAHIILRKSAASKVGAPIPEKTEMPTEAEKAAAIAEVAKAARAIANKIASMSDVTKAYYLALDDAKQDAFLEKSAADQATEAEASKAAKDKAEAEEEARKSGVSASELELRKSNQELRNEIDALKAKDADRDIEKRAVAEFSGYPGGAAELVPLLKSFQALPEDMRKKAEDNLKAVAKAALSSMQVFAGRTEGQMSKAADAQTALMEKAKAYSVEKKVSVEVALEKVSEMAENAELVEAIS
jgi:hypothetical protein